MKKILSTLAFLLLAIVVLSQDTPRVSAEEEIATSTPEEISTSTPEVIEVAPSGGPSIWTILPRVLTRYNYHVNVEDDNLVRVNFMTTQFMRGGVLVRRVGEMDFVRIDSGYTATYHTVYFSATPGQYEVKPIAVYGQKDGTLFSGISEYYGGSRFVTIQ